MNLSIFINEITYKNVAIVALKININFLSNYWQRCFSFRQTINQLLFKRSECSHANNLVAWSIYRWSCFIHVLLYFNDSRVIFSFRYRMGDNWKFLVVDLVTSDGLQVCRVSERWIHDANYILIPNYRGPKYDRAVRNHEEPDSKYTEYSYVQRKVCGKAFVVLLLL